MKFLFYTLCIIIIGGTVSCKKENANPPVRGRGTVNIEPRNVAFFKRIDFRINGELRISKEQDGQKLRIETNENLMKYIKTEVDGEETLKIYSTRNIIYNDLLIFHVNADNLIDICLNSNGQINVLDSNFRNVLTLTNKGTGNIYFSTFCYADVLNINNSGTGNIELKHINAYQINATNRGTGNIEYAGNIYDQQLELIGSGNINASDATSANCRINNSGSGNAYVKVNNKLIANITGSGNVYYKGNPSIMETQITGTGKLVIMP